MFRSTGNCRIGIDPVYNPDARIPLHLRRYHNLCFHRIANFSVCTFRRTNIEIPIPDCIDRVFLREEGYYSPH